MPKHVVNGAFLQCTSGSLLSNLVVLPVHRKQIEGQDAANIMDHVPTVNICPFGVCAVTEVACVPATPMPWSPGSPTVTLDGQPALDDPSTTILVCVVGGTITVEDAGQKSVEIP